MYEFLSWCQIGKVGHYPCRLGYYDWATFRQVYDDRRVLLVKSDEKTVAVITIG